MRRYSEMGQIYGMSEGDLAKTLIININNEVVSKIKELDENKQKFVAEYIYLLALSSFKKLTNEESEKFQKSCFALLKDYAK